MSYYKKGKNTMLVVYFSTIYSSFVSETYKSGWNILKTNVVVINRPGGSRNHPFQSIFLSILPLIPDPLGLLSRHFRS